jgi:hypothetical protein
MRHRYVSINRSNEPIWLKRVDSRRFARTRQARQGVPKRRPATSDARTPIAHAAAPPNRPRNSASSRRLRLGVEARGSGQGGFPHADHSIRSPRARRFPCRPQRPRCGRRPRQEAPARVRLTGRPDAACAAAFAFEPRVRVSGSGLGFGRAPTNAPPYFFPLFPCANSTAYPSGSNAVIDRSHGSSCGG